MRILTVHAPGDLRLDEVASPVAGDADVVVQVRACGVCGSDLGFLRHGGVRRPMAIGHEAAGEIIAVGNDVTGLSVGQRVIVNPMRTPDLIGNGAPEGAFADLLLVRQAMLGDNLHLVPNDLPWDVAALAEPLAVSLHGVNRAAARPGDKVVIYGCGPIGLGLVLWLADRGVGDVVAIDLSPQRLALAMALARARRSTPAGRMCADASASCTTPTGSSAAMWWAATCSSTPRGALRSWATWSAWPSAARLVVMAASHEAVPLALGTLLANDMTITAALAYPDEMPEVVAALPRLRAKAERMISHRLPLARAVEAFAIAATPQSAKVMVEMTDG